MHSRLLSLACAPLLLLAACGDDSSEPEVQAEPETRSVIVTLTDTVPFELLGNLDDFGCYIQPESAEVTLRDADGAIVATETISGEGGVNGENLCEWDVRFREVEPSDFYEAVVKSGEWERKGTSAAADTGSTRIAINF